eukprot:scaffold7526_cov258-Pinguiococcus_pyrenoidosus.AAC.1
MAVSESSILVRAAESHELASGHLLLELNAGEVIKLRRRRAVGEGHGEGHLACLRERVALEVDGFQRGAAVQLLPQQRKTLVGDSVLG